MRNYQTLPTTNEKEKIVGGILNIYQLFWLIGGAVFGLIMFFAVYQFSLTLGGILVVVGILSSAPFIFYKPKEGLTLFKYLFLKHKFKKKTKKLRNIKNERS